MSELKYAIVCETALLDKKTEQVSIINIINGITTPSIPVQVDNFFLVMSWQRSGYPLDEDERLECRLYIKKPDSTQQVYNPFEIKIPKGKFTLNSITPLRINFTMRDENKIIIEQKHKGKWQVANITSIIVTEKKSD